MKYILLMTLLCVLDTNVYASQTSDDVINQMRQFHPESVMEGYTDAPIEANLTPDDESGKNWLLQQAIVRANQDKAAQLALEVANQPKLTPNFKSDEMLYAEKLLNQEDDEKSPPCHYEPVPCESTYIEKKCDEYALYTPEFCENKLQVEVHRIDHPEIVRIFLQNLTNIDLTSCAPYPKGVYCNDNKLFKLNPNCVHLDVHLTIGNQEIALTKLPTCASPLLSFVYPGNARSLATNIHLVEYWGNDEWIKTDCAMQLQDKGFCLPDVTDPCLDPNQTKIINGIPITKACWGEKYAYQCTHEMSTTCTPWLDAGCSNTKAVCVSDKNGHCDHVEKTFQCTEKTCFPDRWVCPEKPACIGDECDDTVDEYATQEDLREGISRLGVLAETASEMSKAQPESTESIDANTVQIFTGAPFTCESWPLGSRDCCLGKGFLEGVFQCPSELKALERARDEGRVESVGEYNDGFFDSITQHVFCIFPSRLAGIIQLGGRKDQLHIPFGNPRNPDCRGITALELERLDFAKLDISGLVAEMTAKTVVPTDADIKEHNLSHANALHDKGQAHD